MNYHTELPLYLAILSLVSCFKFLFKSSYACLFRPNFPESTGPWVLDSYSQLVTYHSLLFHREAYPYKSSLDKGPLCNVRRFDSKLIAVPHELLNYHELLIAALQTTSEPGTNSNKWLCSPFPPTSHRCSIFSVFSTLVARVQLSQYTNMWTRSKNVKSRILLFKISWP